MVNTKCYLKFAVTFQKAKGPLHSVFADCSQLNCEWVKRPYLPGMEKTIPWSWKLQMIVLGGEAWWCLGETEAFSAGEFYQEHFQILCEECQTSDFFYCLLINLTQTQLRTCWILVHKVLQEGRGIKEAREGFSEGLHWRRSEGV